MTNTKIIDLFKIKLYQDLRSSYHRNFIGSATGDAPRVLNRHYQMYMAVLTAVCMWSTTTKLSVSTGRGTSMAVLEILSAPCLLYKPN